MFYSEVLANYSLSLHGIARHHFLPAQLDSLIDIHSLKMQNHSSSQEILQLHPLGGHGLIVLGNYLSPSK